MDNATQERLDFIAANLECIDPKMLSYSQRCGLLNDIGFLLQLVHSQQAEVDRLNNVTLERLLVDPTGINMSIKGNAGLNFMATLIKFFEDNGGENYVTMTFEKDTHKYEVTITNLHGVSSAAEKIDELETELAAFNAMREPVQWFAGEMEKTLRDNDDKGGWSDCPALWLLSRAREELDELHGAIAKHKIGDASADRIIREATDVANFAMMIADIARREKEAATK